MILVDSKTRSEFKTGPLRVSFFFVGAIFAALLGGCDSGPEVIELTGAKFGTHYNITVVADQPAPSDLAAQVEAILDRVDASMSTYKADSELSQLNGVARSTPHAISAPFAEVLDISADVWRLSAGAFDPTVGPLVDLWGFGPSQTGDKIPTSTAIQSTLASAGFDAVTLQSTNTGVFLRKSRRVQLDLSAVAKGYAVDLIADYLEMNALPDYLVEIGGELRVSGNNPQGELWRVAVEIPQLTGGVERILHLQDVSLATSGDYRNYFERDGKRYSHMIDPRSGYPIDHALASVTVVMPRCAEADAWATAFLVMGEEQAIQRANELGLAIYLLVRKDDGFIAQHSLAFAPYMKEDSASSDSMLPALTH